MSQIKRFDIKSISKKLIEEDCICLCSNCHTLFHSTKYKEFGWKIIGRKYKEQIEETYNYLERNVLKFKFKKIDIKDPLN